MTGQPANIAALMLAAAVAVASALARIRRVGVPVVDDHRRAAECGVLPAFFINDARAVDGGSGGGGGTSDGGGGWARWGGEGGA